MVATNKIEWLLKNQDFKIGCLNISLAFALIIIIGLLAVSVFASAYDKRQLGILIQPLILLWFLGYLYKFYVTRIKNSGDPLV